MTLDCQTNTLTFVTQDEAPALSHQSDKKAPSTAGMTTKVVKGSLWTMIGHVIPLMVSLATMPFTIRLLGSEGYGIVVLIALIPTYLGFADFGMGMASTKFGSEAYGEGDADKEARVIRTSALIVLMFSVPVAIALMIFANSVIGIFSVSDAFQAEAVMALRIASVTFVLNLLVTVFNTPQLSRLRMDLNTFINAGTRIAGLIATPIVLYLGFGIIGAVTVLLIAAILNLAGQIFISAKLLPQLFGISFDKLVVRPMLRFGGAYVVGAIAGLLLVNIEKGILAKTVSTTALAYYSVAFTLATMLTLFSGSMVQSLIPAFSQLQGEDKREQLKSIYSRAIRLSMIWSLPLLAVLALAAKPFFTLWAGPEFGEQSSLPLYFLLGGLLFNIFALIPHSIILASGRTDILAKLYWLQLPPYALLVWWLSSHYGAAGAAAAWSLRVIVDTIIHFYLVKRVSGLQPERNGIAGFALGIIILSFPVAATIYFGQTNIWIIGLAVVCLAIYFYVIWTTIITREELNWALNIAKSKFGKLKV